MSTVNAEQKTGVGLKSILFKMMAVVILVGTVVVGPLAVMSFRTADQMATSGVQATANSLSRFVANDVKPAIKFGKGSAIDQTFASLDNLAPGAFVAGLAIGADGNIISERGLNTAALVAQAQAAFETNSEIVSEDGFSIALPIATNEGAEPFGAIAILWTADALKATAMPMKLAALAVAGAVFAIGFAGIILFMRHDVTKPMFRLGHAVNRVAQAEYDIEVPGRTRKDEIGVIATALDGFRSDLAANAKLAITSSYRSAAFAGSSAALMIFDDNLRVISANPAACALFEKHQDAIAEHVKNFDVTNLEGTDLERIHPRAQKVRKMIGDATSFPLADDVKLGDVRLTTTTASVKDDTGATIGFVMEWQDVTQEFLRRGVLDAIRANQLTARFSLDGRVVDCNENFAHVLGHAQYDIIGQNHSEFIHAQSSESNEDIWKEITATGKAFLGRFQVDCASGVAIVEGSLSVVHDVDGTPLCLTLIGNDISENLALLERAEKERAAMQAALSHVVEKLSVGLRKLSDGDLASEITSGFAPEYEQLRSDFNAAIARLRGAIQSVVENAALIKGEASEISNAADDLSVRTEKQASALEQTATALDELTSSVKSAAEGASQASHMVSEAKKNAEASGDVVNEAVEAMSEIEASSGQISKITSLIDDIAFQTNLLALNAGVEAARAGEAGRGFAVVASEVRALAQRSSDAAREINQLISSSGTQVKRGVSLVGQAGDALRGIVTSVSEIASHVDEIAMSSREQSVGLAEINASINQLDQVTQQNAAMFEETTAASHALNREIDTLNQTTAMFNLGHKSQSPGNLVRADFAKASESSSAPVAPQIAAPSRSAGPAAAAAKVPEPDDWEDF